MLYKIIYKILKYFNNFGYEAQMETINIKNSNLPELTNKNIVYPENKTKKELNILYAEIRELQAINREKINKNKLRCSVKM